MQTSDALGVAGVTLGSRLQAGIALLNKEVGLPHGKIQWVLQVLLGHPLSRLAICRSMFRTAALGGGAFQVRFGMFWWIFEWDPQVLVNGWVLN
ncbi:MAG: hypothetical protein WCO91_12185 [Gemmataceae bacterium]